MKSNSEIKSFESENEAKILLEESRKRIDEIDNALFDLISQRTSLAKDIALSKEYLGMPVYDENREKEVHRKIEKLQYKHDYENLTNWQLNEVNDKISVFSRMLEILEREIQ